MAFSRRTQTLPYFPLTHHSTTEIRGAMPCESPGMISVASLNFTNRNHPTHGQDGNTFQPKWKYAEQIWVISATHLHVYMYNSCNSVPHRIFVWHLPFPTYCRECSPPGPRRPRHFEAPRICKKPRSLAPFHTMLITRCHKISFHTPL